jgi:hypothetical protein
MHSKQNEILHPAYAYGSTTTGQACQRMEEVLKVFENAFGNTNNGMKRVRRVYLV